MGQINELVTELFSKWFNNMKPVNPKHSILAGFFLSKTVELVFNIFRNFSFFIDSHNFVII